jgi:membrane-associated protease RseP (regulator of RpoE activity)
MTILIILGVLFLALVLMVTLGERFAKPVDEKQQAKYSKILPILVFIMLLVAFIKAGFESSYF